MKAIGLTIASLGLVLLAVAAPAATFTDQQGRTLEAEIEGVASGVVTLRLANENEFEVPLAQLVEADQAVVAAWQSRAEERAGPMEPWDWDAEAEGLTESKFRVWLPSGLDQVRGMIVLVPGANGDGRGQINDKSWRALAEDLGFGLIGCFFKSEGASYCYAQNGSGETLLEALEEFAKSVERPEVAEAPVLLWGHSAGGQFNYNFACWQPERTLAFIVNKGGYYYDTPARPATRDIPAILFLGMKDQPVRVKNITALFEEYRPRGALWALCREAGAAHGVGESKSVAQEFFRAVVAERLSSKPPAGIEALVENEGWLGDLETLEVAPEADFGGSKREAAWLPTGAVAEAWRRASQ